MKPFHVCTWLALASAFGCSPSTLPRGAVVPLKRLRLYETGVGYFERTGVVPEGRVASLPVPAGHVDDALKSLVVLGGTKGVGHVTFDSRPRPAAARARARLPADVEADVGFAAVLQSLVGERVALDDGTRNVTGVLVDRVSEVTSTPAAPSPKRAMEEDEEADPESDEARKLDLAVVLTDDGDFMRVEVGRLKSVRPLDPSVRARFRRALGAGGSNESGADRRLDFVSHGELTLGYLAETPVWRTSYRLVFGQEREKALLSAWALVHNDTEESWRQVQIEFANGRPDSFLFPLAAPRYERRPLVTPPRELSSVPQLLGATPDALWGDFTGEEIGLGGLGLVGRGGGGGGTGAGYGRGAGRANLLRGPDPSDLLRVGDLSRVDDAQGADAPTVFVYKASRPLDLPARRSALVPFLQRSMEAQIITWFDGFEAPMGRFAISFSNSGATTLPRGPVSVFADGGFAGETVLDRLAPGERRYEPIADDLDVTLDKVADTSAREPKKLVYRKGRLEEHYLRRRAITFTLSNRSGRPRQVFVRLSARSNAKVEGAPRVEFDRGRDRPLAVFDVAPRTEKKTESITVVEGLRTVSSRERLDVERLEELALAETLPPRERAVAKEVATKAAAAQVERSKLDDVEVKLAEAEKDIDRLRGHLKALQAETAGPDNPILTRLLANEDRLAQLREEKRSVERSVAAANREVEAALASLE